jgi:hypothetical protein
MDSLPPLSASAQSLLTTGFASLNRAAAQFASLTLPPAQPANPTRPAADPFLGGLLDLMSSREEVSAGIILLDTSARLSQDLLQVADPYDPTAPHPKLDRSA